MDQPLTYDMRADEFIQDIHRNFDQLTLLEPEQASVLEDEFPLRCRGDGIAQVADLRTHVLKPAGGWSFFRVNPAAVKVIVHGDSWAIPRWRRVRFKPRSAVSDFRSSGTGCCASTPAVLTVSWMASRQDSRPSSTTLSGRPSPA